MLFSVAEFPDQASINVLDEHGTIKNLGRFSIMYSACSSFAALSGNSDLKLHSPNQTTKEEAEVEEKENSQDNSSVEWEDSESGSSKESADELESEEDDEEFHREPIDHLIQVKAVLLHVV